MEYFIFQIYDRRQRKISSLLFTEVLKSETLYLTSTKIGNEDFPLDLKTRIFLRKAVLVLQNLISSLEVYQQHLYLLVVLKHSD